MRTQVEMVDGRAQLDNNGEKKSRPKDEGSA